MQHLASGLPLNVRHSSCRPLPSLYLEPAGSFAVLCLSCSCRSVQGPDVLGGTSGLSAENSFCIRPAAEAGAGSAPGQDRAGAEISRLVAPESPERCSPGNTGLGIKVLLLSQVICFPPQR